MLKREWLKLPLKGFSSLRTLHYFIQFQTLSRLTHSLPFVGSGVRPLPVTRRDLKKLFHEMRLLVDADVENIAAGVYPAAVLKPESIIDHTLRIPRLFVDGLRLTWRRDRRLARDFSAEVAAQAAQLPEYYRRNFHFQTDGYLSEHSAELYEHQVELLFSGMADAMRRIFLRDLKTEVQRSEKAESPLDILETACGTGRATRFVKLTFPGAKITAADLSAPYLKVAQRRLMDLRHISFIQADAAQLPFKDGSFDVTYNVFLFHELPRAERVKVLREAWRVLRPGGLFAAVDSLQLGDRPDFDPHLKRFPVDYHEPFYTDYIKNPMAPLLEEAGFQSLATGYGFLSKYWVARKVN